MDLYNGQGYVELLDTIPSVCPDGLTKDYWIAECATVSTQKNVKDVETLLGKLFSWKHFSPFEQVHLSFRVEAPAVVFWQMDRHRTFQYASHIRRSGRYTKFTGKDFYVPDADYNVTSAIESAILSGLKKYNDLLEQGVQKEVARLVLPAFCMLYSEVMSVNLKNLMHFLSLRTNPAAQSEIRELAHAMFTLVEKEFPITMKLFGKDMDAINYTFGEL